MHTVMIKFIFEISKKKIYRKDTLELSKLFAIKVIASERVKKRGRKEEEREIGNIMQ